MRVYPRPLTLADAVERMRAWVTTHRASAGWSLTAAGLGLVAACGQLVRVPDLVGAPRTFLALFGLAFLAYAAGVILAERRRDCGALTMILAVAVLARLLMLTASPSLSTDAYRYVWDARVAAAGIDPYAYVPVAPEVAALREETIYPHLNHPTWRTVYPPLAQAFFSAVYRVAPDSVFAMKVALGGAELLALAAVTLVLATLGLPLGRLVIYAWNPLVLVEIWGSAHLDGLVLATVTAAALASARHRDGLAAALLGLGTLVKIHPAILVLLLPGRRRPAVAMLFVAVIVLGTVATGGFSRWPVAPLGRYVADEHFNPGLVRSIVSAPALTLVSTALWVALAAWRAGPGSLAERALPMAAGFVVLAPNVFPWYAVWLVPFLAVTPSAPWIAFTGTVAFAYTFFLSEPWGIPLWARLLEVAPLALAFIAWGRERKSTCRARVGAT